MSTAQDNNARSWRRLRYLPPTLGLLRAADARGATLLAVLSAGMGLFAVADVHVLRRLIETAQQVMEGNASLGAGLLWGLVLALLALLQAAVLYGRGMLAQHHQEVLAAFVEERCLQLAQSMPLEWFEHNEHYDLNGTKLSRFSSIFSAKIEEKDCTRADFMEAFEYENITTFPTRF